MSEIHQPWAQRPWILAALLSFTGLVLYLIINKDIASIETDQMRAALAAFVVVAATSFAYSLERIRWQWAVTFALFWGFVLALVAYSTFVARHGSIGDSFSFFSGLLAAAIALPVFQTIRKHGSLRLPYQDLHASAWAAVVSWCASWLFVGISFVLAYLLAELFDLIGIELLKNLLRKGWFSSVFIGASFGAALGVLKENDRIIGNLQKLVMTVLSILAPVMCVSLILFLVALPITGLQAFWDATRGTTPILMSCVIGSVVLSNAIIRNASEEESSNRIMRYSAIGLSVCVLPLAVIALISMQQRLQQYGLTPDRIWGMLAVFVGIAYGLAYLWSILMGRSNWASNIRTNNTRLALLLCALTLFLALPIVNFAKISVESQLSRLSKGKVQGSDFDFAAFAFEFGKAGRDALETMKSSDKTELVEGASAALSAENRWDLQREMNVVKSTSRIDSVLSIYPHAIELPDSLKAVINSQGACLGTYCLLFWESGAQSAQLVGSKCYNFNHRRRGRVDSQNSDEESTEKCHPTVLHFNKKGEEWRVGRVNDDIALPYGETNADNQALLEAIERKDIEIRKVEVEQIFIGGRPVGSTY